MKKILLVVLLILTSCSSLDIDKRINAINELNNNFDSDESLIHTFLKIIGHWPLKSEIIDGIEYQYWINDEAFNWYLLASRIIFSVKDEQNIKKLDHFLSTVHFLPSDILGSLGTTEQPVIKIVAIITAIILYICFSFVKSFITWP